jgi:glycosyltransferase involved in cell wall biosynthesis
MKTTVIINTYNEDKNILQRAVQSYIDQCHQLIISTVEGDPSIKYIKGVDWAILPKAKHAGKSPFGSFQQINNALPLVTGDYFCWASGNDYAKPHKVLMEVDALIRTGAHVCYSSFIVDKPNTKRIQAFHDYDYQKHLQNNFVSDCAMMSRYILEKYLPFHQQWNNMAFWDLWLRIYEGEGNVFTYNNIPTWTYVHRDSDMSKMRKKSPEQIAKNNEDRTNMLKYHESIKSTMGAGNH